VLPVLVVCVNVRIHVNAKVLYIDSNFDIHNISYTSKSEIKYDSRETDDRYVVLKLRLGGTIPPSLHKT
jgi:hypothetical protein